MLIQIKIDIKYNHAMLNTLNPISRSLYWLITFTNKIFGRVIPVPFPSTTYMGTRDTLPQGVRFGPHYSMHIIISLFPHNHCIYKLVFILIVLHMKKEKAEVQ